jgi:carbohydrate-selective porin OprB
MYSMMKTASGARSSDGMKSSEDRKWLKHCIVCIAVAGALPTLSHADDLGDRPTQSPGVSSVAQNTGDSESPGSPVNAKSDATKQVAQTNSTQTAPPARPSPAQFDAVYGTKGWDTPFPSYSDTLTQDVGGYRTALAKYGIGFTLFSTTIFQANVLDTPRSVPSTYPPCTSPLGGNCAGGHSYFGQSPDVGQNLSAYVTYDLGRIGLTGGQLAASFEMSRSTDQAYMANSLRVDNLSYYQPLFGDTLELKIGWLATMNELIGLNIGGSYANPFGPAASIPAELGMSVAAASTPAVRLKWNITKSIYNQFLIQRSEPVNGPTGDPLYDEVNSGNSWGLTFSSPIKGTGVLYTDEVGYQKAPLQDSESTWIRAGAMYNTSQFKDLANLATGATKPNASGFYFLADRQLWQQDPSSDTSAYRGIYGGVSAMYTSSRTAAFYQYYEARLYWIGAFKSRPADMISLNIDHNTVSPYLENFVNASQSSSGIGAVHGTNTVVLVYTARLHPGAYASVGLSYTDNPSPTYFHGEGSSLNVVGSLVLLF